MPKQPTWEDLGAAPGVAGARPVGSYDDDAYGRGAREIAEAGERFGASVARLGAAGAEYAARRARQEFNAARTRALGDLLNRRSQPTAYAAPEAGAPQPLDQVFEAVDGGAAHISSEPLKLAYLESMRPVIAQETRNVALQDHQPAANADAAGREQLVAQLEQNPSTDPDDALAGAAIDNIHSRIQQAVDNNYLPPDQAAFERKNVALRLTAATYGKIARDDPERAIRELTADESPHPLVQYLPADTRDALVAQAQFNARAKQLDDERNAVLAAQDRKRADGEAHGRYVKLALAGTPDLASRIANDTALTPEGQSRLLDTVERTTEPDPPAAVSRANSLQLLDRIGRSDGDAERIVDPNEILEAYNRGEISKSDYEFLSGELAEARTPEGAELAAMKRAFVRAFKPVVDPHRPDAEAIATEQTYQLEQALAQKIARMRASGRDPRDLFDPAKPDYIESHFELVPQFLPREHRTPPPHSPCPRRLRQSMVSEPRYPTRWDNRRTPRPTFRKEATVPSTVGRARYRDRPEAAPFSSSHRLRPPKSGPQRRMVIPGRHRNNRPNAAEETPLRTTTAITQPNLLSHRTTSASFKTDSGKH